MHRKRWFRTVAAASVLATGVFLAACGDDDEGAGATPDAGPPSEPVAVDVLGVWGEEELAKFEAMVSGWETSQNGTVNFTGTRDITAILTTRVEGGNPPDIAIPPEVGLFQQFASEGKLAPLSDCGLEAEIKANYPEAFVNLGSVNGALYGFFMKADTKGTVWYNPKTFAANGWEPLTADNSWEDLVALSEEILASGLAPWSIGVESGGASGWPGSDWLQQIILNEHGNEVYDGLIDGSIPWTDERVKDAWEKFGQVALPDDFTSQGGPVGINATGFVDSSYPPYEDPPTAAMLYLGSFAAGFISDQFPDAEAGEDYAFFPFPSGGVTGGANIVYAFNSDEGTCSLLSHLASAPAQRTWVAAGGFISLNKNVPTNTYPDAITRAAAEQLLEAPSFKFDLDDTIGGAAQTAVFVGVTEYLSDPDSLDDILAGIEAARE